MFNIYGFFDSKHYGTYATAKEAKTAFCILASQGIAVAVFKDGDKQCKGQCRNRDCDLCICYSN